LQSVKRGKQGFEGTRQQRLCRFVTLVGLKGRQAFCLEHAFGFIREQNGITIKGNANFVRMFFRSMCRMGIHLCSGHACIERGTHVGQMGRQKQIGIERFQIPPR